MPKVLIVEDDSSIRTILKINLIRNNFEVFEAKNGESAKKILEKNPDIAISILDIMLPGISGFELCEHIRKVMPNIGIIMLTARVQEKDKINGLDKGADDYMTKPFSPMELIARVKSLHRRVVASEKKLIEAIIKRGPFELNIEARICLKNGKEIELTRTEFMMLKLFFEENGATITRNDLLNKIWGENFYGDMKIVDVNIRRLRRKIEDNPSKPIYIETVWGTGYRLNPEFNK
ncbi:MAG: DNA-binding response regulator [Clostridiales bacterium]|nr:MAG: DNA-binding response regulator [Clostridiales bacterium]